MKIRFTSNTWEEISSVISKAIRPLENEFNHLLSNVNYGGGVSQFFAVIIAIDSIEVKNQNEKFSKSANKSGSFKHLLTGERIKYISFALEHQYEDLEGKDESEIRKIFCLDLYHRLDVPNIKIPKGFDYEKFSFDIKRHLEKYIK